MQPDHVPAWLGWPLLIAVLAFVVFAFRQGFKVKPHKGSNSASDAISLNTDNNLHH